MAHKLPANRDEQRYAPYYAQQRGAPEPPAAARSVAAPGLCKPARRTGCCTNLKQQAAMFETVGDGGGLLL
ncbi:MAG: hypothetical protein LBD24_04270 [Spirochaetaceae bacterium]|nr:hypothetical protein [Spirochaetaceae bacterium]